MKSLSVLFLIATGVLAQDRLQFSITASGGSEAFAPFTSKAADPIVEYGSGMLSASTAYSFGKVYARFGLDVIMTDSYENADGIDCYAKDTGFGGHLQLEWNVTEMFVPFIGVSVVDSIDLEYRTVVGSYKKYDIVENSKAEAVPGIGGYFGAYVYRDGPWYLFVQVGTRGWTVEFEDRSDRCQSVSCYLGTEYRF